jgi:heme o synthase
MGRDAVAGSGEALLTIRPSLLASLRQTIATYYRLTKPERTLANVMTASAGFLLAAKWHINFTLLAATLVGTSFLVASACVLNNYIDRDLDTKMARTKKRALARRTVSGRSALIYATVLGASGLVLLARSVNWLVVVLGLVAYVDYIVLYGISKRHSVHGTMVGTISGAMPITAGYCAVTGRIDAGAVILFLTMTFWQMPHFFAIAIYRMKDYAAGGIPVLPIKKGIHRAKVQIMLYAAAFTVTAISLSLFGYTGYIYAGAMALIGGVWLWRGFHGFKADNDVAWARKMFFFSLKALVVLSLLVAVGGLLP